MIVEMFVFCLIKFNFVVMFNGYWLFGLTKECFELMNCDEINDNLCIFIFFKFFFGFSDWRVVYYMRWLCGVAFQRKSIEETGWIGGQWVGRDLLWVTSIGRSMHKSFWGLSWSLWLEFRVVTLILLMVRVHFYYFEFLSYFGFVVM